jgi:hypothetical protein
VDKWGGQDVVNTMSKRLAQSSQIPHIVLPDRVKPLREQIARAVDTFINPYQVKIPERVFWILGALSQLTEQGAQNYALLENMCDPILWDCMVHQEMRGAGTIFQRAGERARHFLCLIGAKYVDTQVLVKENHGFRGFADFAVNHNKILELKFSTAENNSFTSKVLWPMQAAIYAYTLQKETAYVFNLDKNYCCVIHFNKNLYL